MNETAKQQLPSGPSTLCFNKEDFMKVCALINLCSKMQIVGVSRESLVVHTHHVLTLCGLTSQKTNRGGLGLSGSVHVEAYPCFPNFI